jgi:hypothetical protein
MTSKYWL